MNKNVILFPHFIERAIEKVNHLMRKSQYQEAINVLEEIILHEKNNYELNSRLLQSYLKLNQIKAGLSLVEELLENRSSAHFSEYFQYYLILLMEQSKYAKILKEISQHKMEIKNMDDALIEQYSLYASEQLEKQKSDLLNRISDHLQRRQLKTVFNLLFKWQSLDLDIPKEFETYIMKRGHPILKTKMLLLMKEKAHAKVLTIEKFDQVMLFSGKDLPNINIREYGSAAFKQIEHVESSNPTLHQLVLELLHQYLYIIYPFKKSEDELLLISDQIIAIAQYNLGITTDFKPNQRTHEIIQKIKLYEEVL